MEKDLILHGVSLGEHGFSMETIGKEIQERVLDRGFNFITLRPARQKCEVPQETYVEWARLFKERGVYFSFVRLVQKAPEGKLCIIEPETLAKMKEIAGEYFLGDTLGETGTVNCCRLRGYFAGENDDGNEEFRPNEPLFPQDRANLREAAEGYLSWLKKIIDAENTVGMPVIAAVEATALHKYGIFAGVQLPLSEVPCGTPEIQLAFLRGAARGLDRPRWGTYVAHEWYAGMRHDDILKRKRLELVYKYCYLAGSQMFMLESGDEVLHSYGHHFDIDSELCENYRRVIAEHQKWIESDARPVGGPKVKVALVSGRWDAWGGWGGSSLWCQFDRPEWAHGEAEFSWRLTDEIGQKRAWDDIQNYGDHDVSAAPAYGMYDVLPIEADVEKFKRYDRLIFLGWNSMTDEILDKLIEYVQNGGHILLCAAHLNTNEARDGKFTLPSAEKIATLFGVKFTGEQFSTNDGVKFLYESLDPEIKYPGTKDFLSDPIFSAGFANYAKVELCGGELKAFLSNAFINMKPGKTPAVVEHRLGKGVATLVTTTNYPGNPAVTPLYRCMMREQLTASARNCDIQVLGPSTLRWSVYEGDKIYLLNTDYDLPIFVKVRRNGEEQTVQLEPLELRAVNP